MKVSHVVAVLIVIATTTQAVADVTLGPFNINATFESVSLPLDTSAGGADTYSSYTVTTTWNTDATGSFSDEAVWEFVQPGSPYLLAAPGPSVDSTDEDDPVTLTWAGLLTETYHAGDPLVIRASQTLRHTSASWTNVVITLHSGSVAPPSSPAAMNLGDVESGWASAYALLDSNGIAWFKFRAPDVTTAGCEVLRIDTIGSTLAGGVYRGGNDTEIALYNAIGQLRATGDDIDMLAEELHAALSFGANEGVPVVSSGDLTAGEYYVAVAGFDADFGVGHFEVTPDSAVEGTLRINIRYGDPALDCNANGVADVCDVTSSVSADVNTNGIPDECEDCNNNGVLDTDEIAAGLVEDCNSNSVPDACDVARRDCNFNTLVDTCEVAAGSSADCNKNGVPDECDLAGGASGDCNGNGIPDECDFEQSLLYGLETIDAINAPGTSLEALLPGLGEYWIGYLDEPQRQALGLAAFPHAGGDIYALIAPCEDHKQCSTRSLVRFKPGNILIPTTAIAQFSEEIVDIAFSPDGTLYGVVGSAGSVPGEIVTIDKDTGEIGHIGLYGNGVAAAYPADAHSIAFHPRTGLLYHTYNVGTLNSIETIDITSGTVKPVISGADHEYYGLAFGEEVGLLLAAVSYYSVWIDPATGQEVGVGPISGDLRGLTFTVSALDCNNNGIPDTCDAAQGVAPDFDSDGLLDLCDYDNDNDGLDNAADVCDYTPLGEAITLFGGPKGAWTDDCVVDIQDYPYYSACLEIGGPAIYPGEDCLSVFDVTGDGRVDLADFAAFQSAFGS